MMILIFYISLKVSRFTYSLSKATACCRPGEPRMVKHGGANFHSSCPLKPVTCTLTFMVPPLFLFYASSSSQVRPK